MLSHERCRYASFIKSRLIYISVYKNVPGNCVVLFNTALRQTSRGAFPILLKQIIIDYCQTMDYPWNICSWLPRGLSTIDLQRAGTK